jgi:hypothetical protein
VPESKVISLDKRAEEEEKSFFEQLFQGGARKLLQAAIENEVMDAHPIPQGIAVMRMASGWLYATGICRSGR